MSRRKDMGRPTALRNAADVRRWDREADVIVVGLGAAGACAAIEAAGAGADVLVLERAGGGGGTSALSTGQLYLGGGTPIQKACGFDDSADEMFKFLAASCGPGADEAKIRLFCDHSVEHFHWLVAAGVPFKESFYGDGSFTLTDDCLSFSGNESVHPYPEIAKPAPRGHTVLFDGVESGAVLMQKLVAAVGRTNAAIEVDTLVETLVVDAHRRIVGVVAVVAGEERVFRARRGVILTAGGFINNREMVDRYAPALRKCRLRNASDGDDGRGIRMGMAAGGDAIRMDTGCIVLPFSPPKILVKGILVNRRGQRFISEDAYQTTIGEVALLHQNGEVFLIVDDETFARPFAPAEIAAVAETHAELESELGFPEGSLQHTLAVYNEHAAAGVDPYHHKSAEHLKPITVAPFAAIDLTYKSALYAVFTLGGLHTLPTGEVVSPDGDPIPGLFAAGRTTSGLAAQGYNSGLSLSDATFFGRIAGRIAAQRG